MGRFDRTPPLSRRELLIGSVGVVLAARVVARGADLPAEPVIDIHQHTNYHKRSDETLIAHQKAMGVTQTILLPAGSAVKRASTHDGKSNGLAAEVGGTEEASALAAKWPREFSFGANEVTDLPNAREEIETYLKRGAVVIGEQKFGVHCDSAESEILYKLADEYAVPILLHFQDGVYNLGYDHFDKVLSKFPRTLFIGHAQTVWANIDLKYNVRQSLYPRGKVTPGGLTDRYLADFPNFFADLSAGSGLNALERDEAHSRGFLERHQDKLMFGSDCDDGNVEPHGEKASILGKPLCQGAATLPAIRKLAPGRTVERKILYENAKKLFRL